MFKIGYTCNANLMIVFALVCFYVNSEELIADCYARGGDCQWTVGSTYCFWRTSTCKGRFVSADLCSGSSTIPFMLKKILGRTCFGSTIQCCIPPEGKPDYNCFGDFMQLKPTGTSGETSKKNGLKQTGVGASESLIDEDIAELNKRKKCYYDAGKITCIHPAIIAAMASRQSRGGSTLYKTKGLDTKNNFGILQCNRAYMRNCGKHPWNGCTHIKSVSNDVLLDYIMRISHNHQLWEPKYHLQAGIAGYSKGPDNIKYKDEIDKDTDGNDYSNDIIARAQHLVRKYHW